MKSIAALKDGHRRFLAWSAGSPNRRILGALLTVGGFSLLVKVAGFGKQFVIAWCFGTSDALDAFLAALLLPSFLVGVVESSFNAAFLPVYVTVRRRDGEAAAERLFGAVLLWTLALLAVVSLVVLAFSRPLLHATASGFGDDKLALSGALLAWLLPILVLGGLTALGNAVLNARGRFALAAVAPLFVALGPIVALLVFRQYGIYALAGGTIFGALFEVLILAWGLRQQGISLRPRWSPLTPELRQVIDQLLPMVGGALIMGTSPLVDQAMAAALGPGSVSALAYGSRLPTVVVSLGAGSLGTAILPQFSEMAATADWQGIRHTLRTFARLILILVVPATIALVALSEPLTRLFYQRGAFTAADTLLVGRVQALYLLQAPFYLLGILGVRLLSALGRNRILLGVSAVNVAINFAGDWVLMRALGLSGIALSTSLVYLCSMVLIWIAVGRALQRASSPGRAACG